jgi:hypothetical protein
MMKNALITLLFLLALKNARGQDKPVALVGATIIDLSAYGNHTGDLTHSVVLLQNGRIIAAGDKRTVKIPKGARIIHAEGKFIVPGLIDCFSVIGTQGQANSHLYYGVTTIVAGPGDNSRRGYFPNGYPSPHIKKMTSIPSDSLENELEKKWTLNAVDIARVDREIDQIDSLKKAGIGTILLQHLFPEELLPKMEALCEKYGINTIGEIQYAHYSAAIKVGINSFVHTSRYILGAFPDSVFIVARNEHDSSANVAYGKYFRKLDPATNPGFKDFGKALASSKTALMPTLSMLYTSLPDHKNIWKEPGAFLTDYKDVSEPMDTLTGKSTSFMSAKFALRQIDFEKEFIKAGVYYITGSGADAFGALPGISEHIEIAMLHRYGLSNRQAIAAATNNPSVFNHWTNIGLIAAGRNADLLVLSANPLDDPENLKKIDMLWLNGRLINRAALLKPLKTKL